MLSLAVRISSDGAPHASCRRANIPSIRSAPDAPHRGPSLRSVHACPQVALLPRQQWWTCPQVDGVQLASRGGRCEGNFDLSEKRMQPQQEVTPDWLEQLPQKKPHCK